MLTWTDFRDTLNKGTFFSAQRRTVTVDWRVAQMLTQSHEVML